MELTALLNAVIIVLAFVGGFYLAKRMYSEDIQRLTQQNKDLIGSLYHRIGYAPPVLKSTEAIKQMTDALKQSETATEPEAPPRPSIVTPVNAFPDLFQRRQDAFKRAERIETMGQ